MNLNDKHPLNLQPNDEQHEKQEHIILYGGLCIACRDLHLNSELSTFKNNSVCGNGLRDYSRNIRIYDWAK